MKIRTALVIIAIFAMSVFAVPTFGSNPNQRPSLVRVKPHPLLWRAAVKDLPTTTTTDPPVPPVVAPVATTTTTVPTQPVWDTVTPYERVAWSRVAVCEEGGWIGWAGAAYPDSLGISATNWYGNGGGSDLSEDAQIMVAERIQVNPPDQSGCAAW